MNDTILGKSQMAFKLADGTFIHINDIDIREIAKNMWTEIMINNPENVIMLNDVSLVRAQTLYSIYKAEKESMSKTLREKALKNIIELLDTDFDVTTLKEVIKNQKK